ncbi:uncharacterized protein LOC105440124 [Strongylocentrotus purpuratus]|uniref:SWIM-type domain-containing protein n=1 Tax=Strongylocentrotus purpuratus TaxID=7668 RepID=A0A7M7PL26_STRPU|nr:uncharacterized protein LOC105440124 [Strongylocentrotus purpuratus]|eukprot:XP_011668221.1 PREDICTED: uncharacterized protein LOC105440124 [Strongylocentrotus purpuratus]
MLRRCAHATEPSEYNAALEYLKASKEWQENPKLQKWFTKQWIPHSKRWVWGNRCNKGVQVNTNNGLERQNGIFKYSFLEKKNYTSISGMISILILEYLPNSMCRYIREDLTAIDSLGRTYDDAIPPYLQNRPSYFIRHCMRKIEMAGTLTKDDVIRKSEHCFQVKSETTWPRTSYNVHLQTENGIPKCECWDWRWTHLPCKHMFAVLELLPGTTWSALPEKFRNSPLYTLDTEVCGFLEVPAD